MEIGKTDFLSKRKNLFSLLADMDEIFTDKCSIKSVTAINPLKNVKLNRVELLFLLRETPGYLNETVELSKEMLTLERKYNLKISSLILDEQGFVNLLTSDEVNPVREALSQQITLYNPQAFWIQIKEIAQKSQIRTISSETKPSGISESDLTFNLIRFGYSEFGPGFTQGKKFCVEYITTSLLLKEEARGIDAVAVILAKNSFNSNLLAFLSQKYQTAPKLLGILKILGQTNPKPQVNDAMKILKAVNSQELAADEDSIRQKLELYNAL